MDRGSLIGLTLAAVAILGGQAMEGGHVGTFLQPAAFVIVVIGTLGAVMLHHPLPVFIKGVRMAKWAFRPPEDESIVLIRRVVQWAQMVRVEGSAGAGKAPRPDPRPVPEGRPATADRRCRRGQAA
jgi:chemotaxis protein MotA